MVEVNGVKKVIQPNAIDLKETTKMIRRTGREYSLGKVEMSTKVNMWMIKDTDMVRCIGQMDQFTKVIG